MISKKNDQYPEAKQAWERACAEKSNAQKSELFYKWFAHAGDVQKMFVSLSKTWSATRSSATSRACVTKVDLMKKYGPDNADRVCELITRKINLGLWKEHEDFFPGNKDIYLHWAWDAAKAKDSEKNTTQISGRLEADTDDVEMLQKLGSSSSSLTMPPLATQDLDPNTPAGKRRAMKSAKPSKETEEKKEKTAHEKAQDWCGRILTDISETRALILQITSLQHTTALKNALEKGCHKLEKNFSELSALVAKPHTSEVKLLASVKDAHTSLKPMLVDMEQARKLLSSKKVPKL